MAGFISKLSNKYNTYYYFKINYRVRSKKDGTKDKVKSTQLYLGTAEQILNNCGYQLNKKNKIVPYEAEKKKIYEMEAVGLTTSLYNIAESLNLRELLYNHFPGEVSGIRVSDYLLIGAFHRISDPNPKTKIIEWAKKTNIGELFEIDISKLTSQNFWKAYDKVLSEEEVQKRWEIIKRKRTKAKRDKAELGYLCEANIDAFQKALGMKIFEVEKINVDDFYNDLTNFFTYIDTNNNRNHIAAPGNNKKGRKGKRQISLATTISGSYGLPLFHQIYKGNYNDVTIFPEYLGKLMNHCEYFVKHVKEIKWVMDKGNNSQKNMDKFLELKEDYPIYWIGSLRLDYFPKLRKKKTNKFEKEKDGYKYYTQEATVFGKKHRVVLTYYEKTAIRDELTLQRNIEKYKTKILEYWDGLTLKTKKSWDEETRIEKLKGQIPYAQYKKLFNYSWNKKDKLKIGLNKSKLIKIRQGFGKQLLFSTDSSMEAEEIIEYYHGNWKMNQCHKILNMPDTISFSPLWVWTDSKIRVQSMVNILALLLYRLLAKRVTESPENEGISLSNKVIKTILMEIKRVVELQSVGKIRVGFTELSYIHKALCRIFHLKKWVKGIGDYLLN